MRNVDLKVILKPISFLLRKLRRKQKKTSTITIINKGNIVINVDDVKVNVELRNK